jgi:hypothetical protein
MLKSVLDKNIDLQKFLYIRGFLITNDNINITDYPFYNNWNSYCMCNYNFYIHKEQKCYFHNEDDVIFALIGHAYNPFSSDYNENIILKKIAAVYKSSKEEFFNVISELTGIFAFIVIEKDNITFFNDATGMQVVFYGTNKDCIYISSHSKLIGDILNLEASDYVKRLTSYKFYKLFGRMLPGDISPYDDFFRVIPNFYVTFEKEKFFTNRFPDITLNKTLTYEELIDKISSLISKNMELISAKWKKPAISLTGGCDSKTTLACTQGLYDKFSYFSYDSQESERIDAQAAKKICDMLNINHVLYYISRNNEDFESFNIFEKILEYNCGCIGKNNKNDIRKRIFFTENFQFDIEVKSWVSEIGRAYYHKRFKKKKFPKKITPRYLSSLYKVFFHNRKLLHQTDKIFSDFLAKYYNDEIFNTIPWYDIIFWEYRVGAWNGLVISGEHNLSFNITIPYNNRKLLLLFLSTPLNKRISDDVHKDIMKQKNEKIFYSGISVTNVKHTQNRARLERLYLDVQSKIPF